MSLLVRLNVPADWARTIPVPDTVSSVSKIKLWVKRLTLLSARYPLKFMRISFTPPWSKAGSPQKALSHRNRDSIGAYPSDAEDHRHGVSRNDTLRNQRIDLIETDENRRQSRKRNRRH